MTYTDHTINSRDIAACRGKLTYYGEREAKKKAKHFRKTKGTRLVSYRCPVCDLWHLTSKRTARNFTERARAAFQAEMPKEANAPVLTRRSPCIRPKGRYFSHPAPHPLDVLAASLADALIRSTYTY